VITLKPYLTDLVEEWGVHPDTLTLGPNANWYSPFHNLTPPQLQQVGGDAGICCWMSRVGGMDRQVDVKKKSKDQLPALTWQLDISMMPS